MSTSGIVPKRVAAMTSRARADLIETMAKAAMALGLPKSTGQIYGLLYLSPQSLPLEEMAERLSISKASVSTGVRELVAWQVVRQVFVPGERRDFYEAQSDLVEVIRAIYQEAVLPKMSKAKRRLGGLLAALEADRKSGAMDREEYLFCKDRLENIGRLQDQVAKLLPLAEKLI